jgi:aspartyl-tRNA(Asn)/glutamyl-tRNA(Gln) amidotransferase subunit C
MPKIEVKKVATLARLSLTKREEKKLVSDLAKILEMVEKLKKVKIEKVPPTASPRLLENVLRKDRVKISEIEVRRNLVEMAPEKEKGWIKTKPIL